MSIPLLVAAILALGMIAFATIGGWRSTAILTPRPGRPFEYRLVRSDFASNPTSGDGLILCRIADGQRLAWNEFEEANAVQIVRLHGERFHQQISNVGFKPARRLLLRREPHNPYDTNAISVWTADGRSTGGYIPREVAVSMARRLDSGESPTTWSMWEILEEGRRVDLRILIDWDGVVEPISV